MRSEWKNSNESSFPVQGIQASLSHSLESYTTWHEKCLENKSRQFQDEKLRKFPWLKKNCQHCLGGGAEWRWMNLWGAKKYESSLVLLEKHTHNFYRVWWANAVISRVIFNVNIIIVSFLLSHSLLLWAKNFSCQQSNVKRMIILTGGRR